MKLKLVLLAAASICAISSASFAMTALEYTTQKDTIWGDYKVSRANCGNLGTNAKAVCKANAKGIRNVANAILEAAYEPSARRVDAIEIAKR